MGKIFNEIGAELKSWLQAQKIFFVATAPLSEEGHINCSPKGGDSFRVLGSREVAYLDLTGSGVETIAHIQENSRIVLMFCEFSGAPKIIRLHGKAVVIYPQDAEYNELCRHFPSHIGARSIIKVDVTRISDSCGYAVPRFEFLGERDLLDKWCEKKGETGLADYRARKNENSIDGIPGFVPDLFR
jgi:hypothetical protein